MAIKTLEQRKKQQKLVIVTIIIVLIAAAVLFFGLQPSEELSSGENLSSSQSINSAVIDEKLKRATLDHKFVTENILPLLKKYGETPVTKGQVGKPNPFIP